MSWSHLSFIAFMFPSLLPGVLILFPAGPFSFLAKSVIGSGFAYILLTDHSSDSSVCLSFFSPVKHLNLSLQGNRKMSKNRQMCCLVI